MIKFNTLVRVKNQDSFYYGALGTAIEKSGKTWITVRIKVGKSDFIDKKFTSKELEPIITNNKLQSRSKKR